MRERVRRANGHALVAYAADKVSKVGELRILIATGLDRGTATVKLRGYQKSLQMLERAVPTNRLVGLLGFELEALEALPPDSPQHTISWEGRHRHGTGEVGTAASAAGRPEGGRRVPALAG